MVIAILFSYLRQRRPSGISRSLTQGISESFIYIYHLEYTIAIESIDPS